MIRRLVPVVSLVVSSVVAAFPAQAAIAPDTHCRSGKVSITFDDGPHKTDTLKLLKVLRMNHAQATFFVRGKYVERYPKLLKTMIHDGHAVANSPRTIEAVPGIIKGLREKGYCLVPLQVTAKDSQLRRTP